MELFLVVSTTSPRPSKASDTMPAEVFGHVSLLLSEERVVTASKAKGML